MTADEARALFSDAYDGELDAEQKAAFDALLASDAALASEYAAFCKLLGSMASELDAAAAPTEAPAPDLLPGVQRRLRARSRGRFYADRFAERTGSGVANPLLVAAILLALVAVAWLAYAYLQGIELLH